MTEYTSPTFPDFSSGTAISSGPGFFVIEGDGADTFFGSNYLVDESSTTGINVGDTVTWEIYDSSGGFFSGQGATYAGYYLDGGIEYPVVTTGGDEYYVLGQTAETDYTVIEAPYDQGSTVCFCRGTLILTSEGEVPVERLQVGDLVITASGEHRPIKWLGHRRVDCRRHPRPSETQPIRIAAHAFGENRPARDLFVSPGHAICLDLSGEVLITAGTLVNGKTVAQLDIDEVTFWHIEVDSHDILLAENLPCESYLDVGNRGFFAEAATVALSASPDAPTPTDADFCRPFHLDGVVVERAKAILLDRAQAFGHRITSENDLHVIADGRRIDPVRPGERRYAFMLPEECSEISLRSRTFVPAHTCADSTDIRSLGTCIARIQLDDSEPGLDDAPFGEGWNELERVGVGQQRWTTGTTPLPSGTRLIVIDLAGPGHYWEKEERAALRLVV
jgi:Hint domain